MKKIMLSVFVASFLVFASCAQSGTNNAISEMKGSLDNIQATQVEFDKKLQRVAAISSENKQDILTIDQRNEALYESVNSLKTVFDALQESQMEDSATINDKIQKTNEIPVIEKSLNNIQATQAEFDKKLQRIATISNGNKQDIQALYQRNEALCESVNSLKTVFDILQKSQAADSATINDKIQETNDSISVIEKSLNDIQAIQAEFDKKLQRIATISNGNKQDIQALYQRNEALCESVNSLKTVFDILQKSQAADIATINDKIQEAKDSLLSTRSVVQSRTIWGGIITGIILLTLLILSYYLTERIKRGAFAIKEIHKEQESLQKAHEKMLEGAVSLDSKMIELCEQQIRADTNRTGSDQAAHSLALKVADEIVRIEMNLLRMDASIKGYKQLLKAVQRIKDNLSANGYEIVDMLGKPYVAGMKAAVTFITNENLAPGQQIITKVVKPQINFQQQMIQAAQIEVSQPE